MEMVDKIARNYLNKIVTIGILLLILLLLWIIAFPVNAQATIPNEKISEEEKTPNLASFDLTGSAKFLVIDGEEVIKNVKIDILDSDKKVIDTICSGDNGKAEKKSIKIGEYYYKVASVPDDYVLDETENKFEITSATWLLKKIILLKPKVIKNYELCTDSDLRVLSNLTEEDYEKMLEGTELEGIGDALVIAEKEYGVNGLYMLGLACQESGYGTSAFARNRNNVVGWCAYDSNPGAAKYFDSKDECITFVASKLKENYLTKGGMYFEGYTPRAIDVHYCSDKRHADKIVSIVKELVGEIL